MTNQNIQQLITINLQLVKIKQLKTDYEHKKFVALHPFKSCKRHVTIGKHRLTWFDLGNNILIYLFLQQDVIFRCDEAINKCDETIAYYQRKIEELIKEA